MEQNSEEFIRHWQLHPQLQRKNGKSHLADVVVGKSIVETARVAIATGLTAEKYLTSRGQLPLRPTRQVEPAGRQ